MNKITPCLWFDGEAEDAARFYTGIFPNSKITSISHYGEAGREVHGQPAGKVLTVAFELDGRPFTAMNGGPQFKFNEAVSFQVPCRNQEEIDYYWDKLTAGGDAQAQQCGWLKDRYGLSWQVFPAAVMDMLQDQDRKKADRVMQALMEMRKMDLKALERAYAGQ
jgi:predicted 3-demethylubiquinone-9 3-methyltransferase (glyoxalase superfamily)